MPVLEPPRGEITRLVKEIAAAASTPPADPRRLRDDEPLNGAALRINSLTLVAVLMEVEERLDTPLPDDALVGRTFHTLGDLVDAVVPGGVVSP